MKQYKVEIVFEKKVDLNKVRGQLEVWRQERALKTPMPGPVFKPIGVFGKENGQGTLVTLSGFTNLHGHEVLEEIKSSLREHLINNI